MVREIRPWDSGLREELDRIQHELKVCMSKLGGGGNRKRGLELLAEYRRCWQELCRRCWERIGR